MNRCGVNFPCNNRGKQCDSYVEVTREDGFDGKEYFTCFYNTANYCTNKKAQIKALQDEGFSVIDEEKEKEECEKVWSTFPM